MEHKSRGKRIKDGVWIFGDYYKKFIYDSQRGDRFAYYIGFQKTNKCGIVSNEYDEVHPETVGMYTGLKAKHKTPIYRWDFLLHVDHVYLVDWHFNRWVLRRVINGKLSRMHEFDKTTIDAGWLKVCGNKFDHPDLLKEIKTQ